MFVAFSNIEKKRINLLDPAVLEERMSIHHYTRGAMADFLQVGYCNKRVKSSQNGNFILVLSEDGG